MEKEKLLKGQNKISKPVVKKKTPPLNRSIPGRNNSLENASKVLGNQFMLQQLKQKDTATSNKAGNGNVADNFQHYSQLHNDTDATTKVVDTGNTIINTSQVRSDEIEEHNQNFGTLPPLPELKIPRKEITPTQKETQELLICLRDTANTMSDANVPSRYTNEFQDIFFTPIDNLLIKNKNLKNEDDIRKFSEDINRIYYEVLNTMERVSRFFNTFEVFYSLYEKDKLQFFIDDYYTLEGFYKDIIATVEIADFRKQQIRINSLLDLVRAFLATKEVQKNMDDDFATYDLERLQDETLKAVLDQLSIFSPSDVPASLKGIFNLLGNAGDAISFLSTASEKGVSTATKDLITSKIIPSELSQPYKVIKLIDGISKGEKEFTFTEIDKHYEGSF